MTGYNEAFIVNGEKKQEILNNCATEEEREKTDQLIRPILLGKNLKRYRYDWDGYWVIMIGYNTYKSIEKEYNAIYNHLLKYQYNLKNRGQCRYTSSGKVNVNKEYQGQHHWLELDNNPSEEFIELFDKPKIAWGNLAINAQFAFIEEKMCINAPSVFISTDNLYLLSILNSKLSDYYIKQLGVSRNGGYYEFKPMYISQLPIPNISEENQSKFYSLTNEILNFKKIGRDTKELEVLIDSMVYDLYNFSKEEIEFIEIQ